MLSNLKTPVLVAVLGLSLSACANLYDTAKQATPTGDSYSQALFKNYMMLADSERREEDWTDANFFSGKALAAADGAPQGPQELAERMLDEKFLTELSPARASLMDALNGGAAASYPEAAAMAVAGFDCWMQEAEEGFQMDDIAACKKMYEDGMAGIGKPMAMGPWTIYFGFDRSNVPMDEKATVEAAAASAAAMSNGAVVVSGHTDTSGPAQYNLGLSAKRAQSVVDILNSLGIDSSRINVSATGEADLAVPTADGVREPKNRRVEIRVLK
ncbi:MAG: OmpA family protein [Alphaproteobacteria bacterium]|nr:OmpA family protein [Alphaproteobacteria bacterium]MCB9930136.1 OmpA family protein [Alphaproteobacteria bacterium]